MSFEIVTVLADGETYEEWESISVSHEWNSPITVIDLDTTEVVNEAWKISALTKWNFPPGTLIQVYGTSDPLALGVVDIYRPSGTPTMHRVKIIARSPNKYGVDSSLYPGSDAEAAGMGQGTFFNIPFCQLMKIFWQPRVVYGYPIECDAALNSKIVPYHQIRQGATAFQESMRLAPMYGVSLQGLREQGGLKFADGSSVGGSGGYLIQGQNIISMTGEIMGHPRQERHEVIGQGYQDSTQEALEITAAEYDSGAPPGSYKRYPLQGYPTQENAATFAKWARAQTYAVAVKARIQVPGWRVHTPDDNNVLKPSGAFWDTGQTVYVFSQWLKIDCDMFIWGVEFNQSTRGGTTTTLTLVDPAVIPEAGNQMTRCNNGSIWSPWKGK